MNANTVKSSLCLSNEALLHEGVWGSGCIDPHFLDLGTSWRWVVSFTPRSLYRRGRSPRYPLDRRLSGPQSQSGRFGEEKILGSTGTWTPTPRSSSPKPVAIPTALSPLKWMQMAFVITKWYFFPLFRASEFLWVRIRPFLKPWRLHLPTESSTEHLPVLRNLFKTDTEYRGYEYFSVLRRFKPIPVFAYYVGYYTTLSVGRLNTVEW
jgi:hypothetical protein